MPTQKLPPLTEAQFQTQVVQLARLHGWWTWHDLDSRRNQAGLPDLLLVREVVIWVELKTDTGRVRPAQQECMDRLRKAGADVRLWRPKNWPEIVETLTGVIPKIPDLPGQNYLFQE